MYKLKFIHDDDLTIKEFETKKEMDSYIDKNNINKVWHQVEKINRVIPNLKEDKEQGE
ncbi:hypothetical protein [Tepidibacter hydrothermalis]|uniref:Uncharacterized protein n=1 Tax=Tepidibacter hydrothermalis TaxID=3036126 RepID=A0ABY8EB50_9FIRM|nr:hypothetical protein [Tepidibacter hydrothermalis]WFD10142.1 hypothetical protein P4S50_17555 [Tepidibacter hydrothermalis]